jgi:hypothetical protein
LISRVTAKRLNPVGGEIQPLIVRETVRRRVDVSDVGGDDAVALRIDPRNFVFVGFEQSAPQVLVTGMNEAGRS